MVRSGIYAITCTISGKIYVGSSVDIRSRWACHKRDLNKGIHGSHHLQAAWDLYGESTFRFKVLEYVEDKSQLAIIETSWIEIFNANDSCHGYNLRVVTDSNRGMVLSEETKQRISKGLKGHEVSKETRRKVSEELKGKRLSEETRQKISKANKGRPNPGVTMAHAKNYIVIDPNGVAIQVWNMAKFCRERGLSPEGMNYVARGRRSHYHGWKCWYNDEEED